MMRMWGGKMAMGCQDAAVHVTWREMGRWNEGVVVVVSLLRAFEVGVCGGGCVVQGNHVEQFADYDRIVS